MSSIIRAINGLDDTLSDAKNLGDFVTHWDSSIQTTPRTRHNTSSAACARTLRHTPLPDGTGRHAATCFLVLHLISMSRSGQGELWASLCRTAPAESGPPGG